MSDDPGFVTVMNTEDCQAAMAVSSAYGGSTTVAAVILHAVFWTPGTTIMIVLAWLSSHVGCVGDRAVDDSSCWALAAVTGAFTTSAAESPPWEVTVASDVPVVLTLIRNATTSTATSVPALAWGDLEVTVAALNRSAAGNFTLRVSGLFVGSPNGYGSGAGVTCTPDASGNSTTVHGLLPDGVHSGASVIGTCRHSAGAAP